MLEIRHLSKQFSGSLAVDNVSFCARAGEVTGYLGPNGSGKTTLADLLLGVLAPQGGRIEVDGVSRWDSGVVRGGEPARLLPRIDLRGAKQLALIVDAAEDSFVADRADWLRLVLVRGP